LSQQIVADTAIKVAEMQDALGIRLWEGIPSYRSLAIGGNHLEKTDKRLEVLKETNVAPHVRLGLDPTGHRFGVLLDCPRIQSGRRTI